MKRLLIPIVIAIFAISRGVQRILTALALEHLEPWVIAGASLTLATFLWVPFAAWKGWFVKDVKLWLRCAPLGVMNIAIPAIAFTAAQQFVSASAAALLVASMPILIAILAAVLLGEHLKRKAVTGIVVGTIGVVTLTIGKGGSIGGQSWYTGLTLIAIGVVSASIIYVGWRDLLSQYRGVEILAPQLVISVVIIAPVVVATGFPPSLVGMLPVLGALAIVNYIIPQIAMFWLIARTTAVRAAVSNYLAPLIATALAVPILHQRVTLLIVVGGVLIIVGAVLVNTAHLRTTKDRTGKQ
jgi:drug/metabolite transporter (DMT)-like permease